MVLPNFGDEKGVADVLKLSDPTSLAMESVHWNARSASTDDFTVNFEVTLSGPRLWSVGESQRVN